jgi:hypothetical protein
MLYLLINIFMPRRKKQQAQQAEGGIAPLLAARYAAQAAELVYDLLPEKAKDWVDENLGINWAKKNIVGPAVEAVSEVWENIKNPNLQQERQAAKFKEEQDEKAGQKLAEQQAKGWVFECNDPEKGAANCLVNRKIYQMEAPSRGRFVGEKEAPTTWFFNFNPLTGEYFSQTKSWDQMNKEFGDKVRFEPTQKKWVYTAKYQKQLDREEELAGATTEEDKKAVQDKHAQEDAEEEARQKQYREAEEARQAAITKGRLDKQDREIKERYAKKRGITVEQLDAENAAFDQEQNEQFEQLNDAPADQQPEPDQQPEQTSGAGWEVNYGRVGFGAGFVGGARPFNAKNKPTLNLSRNDYNFLNGQNHLPFHYDQGGGGDSNIVLWDNNYTNPLPPAQQLENKTKNRMKKRNYIKNHLDDLDPKLELNEQNNELIQKRKSRREGLVQNPFTAANGFIQRVMPAPYDTAPQLNNEQVRRDPFQGAIAQYNVDIAALQRLAREQNAVMRLQLAQRARRARLEAARRRRAEQEQAENEAFFADVPDDEGGDAFYRALNP